MSSATMERRPGALLGALIGPLLLLVAVGAALLVKHLQPVEIFGLVVGCLVGVPLVWTLVSALWPARADRTCPACGSGGLERLDAETTMGIRCRDCGFRDADQSSWLLAEEEGPLEELVLRSKSRRGPGPGAPPPDPVDTGGAAD